MTNERTRSIRRRAAGAATGALLAAGLAAAPLLVPPVSADPMIANPSFEDGLEGWIVEGDTGAAKTEPGGSDGTARLTHYLAADGATRTHQTVTGLAEGWWTVTAAVKSGGAPGSSTLTLDCGVAGSTVVPSTVVDDAWLRLSASAYVAGPVCDVVIETTGAAGTWASVDDVVVTPGSVDRSVRGADLSGVAKNEDLGAAYARADGSPVDPVQAFADAGANLGRLKVWVDPADGYNDQAHVVATAQRIKAAGMALLVDFHYSDKWTDPGQQEVPAAWAAYTPEELADAVYAHTRSVLDALGEAGIVADAVQVGNEINPGMLWPLGQTYDIDPDDGVEGAQFDNLALFLSAGARAVKDVDPETEVVLHLTNINNGIDGLTWWYDEVTARGVEFDIVGLSYYGYWHGTLADLQQAVGTLSDRYDRDVLVVENAYPFTLADDPVSPWENTIDLESELVADYPATPEGQAAQFRAVQDVVASAPGGRGLGVVYWEPAWTAVPGAGWDPRDPASGNAWENQAMFDFDGRALPALAEYAPDSTAGAALSASVPALESTPGASSEAPITITNSGTATFRGSVAASVTGAGFAVRAADVEVTVAPGATVQAGAVVFSPSAAGGATGELTLEAAGILPAALPVESRVVPFRGAVTAALVGTAAAPPTAPTSPATPPAAPADAGSSPDAAPGDRSRGRLSTTGAQPAGTALLAAALVGIGGLALLAASRRRRAA